MLFGATINFGNGRESHFNAMISEHAANIKREARRAMITDDILGLLVEQVTPTHTLSRLSLTFANVLLLCALTNCSADGYQHCTVLGDSHARVHVAYDSDAFENKVSRALHNRVEYSQNLAMSLKRTPKLYAQLTVHATPLLPDDIAQQPGFDVTGGSGFKILFEENTLPFSKVEFETGPFTGRIGWLQRASMDDPRTRMP